jgi:oligoribonuclease
MTTNNSIPQYFAWIDLETTGLDSNKNHILEVACIITDYQLNMLAIYSAVIKPPVLTRLFPRKYMDDVVFKMHIENNLLKECANGISLKQCEQEFIKFLSPFRNSMSQNLYFAGNSIGALDLPFLRKHMPAVMKQVHYRCLDVSGLRIGLEQIYDCPNLFYNRNVSKSSHRALNDCERAINQLKNFRWKILQIEQAHLRLLNSPEHHKH